MTKPLRISIALSLTAITLSGCGGDPGPSEVDRYTSVCHERGGFISRREGGWNIHYNCVGQTTQPDLPELVR
jgi:hypothetical protein